MRNSTSSSAKHNSPAVQTAVRTTPRARIAIGKRLVIQFWIAGAAVEPREDIASMSWVALVRVLIVIGLQLTG
jgi:hypothetical protein